MAVEKDTAHFAQRLEQFLRSELASLYDEKRDVLFIFRIGEARRMPAVAIDVNGEFWIRQDPKSGDIDDVEIEDLESVFLPRYPQLQAQWLEAKFAKGDNAPNRAFISEIVTMIREAHSAAA